MFSKTQNQKPQIWPNELRKIKERRKENSLERESRKSNSVNQESEGSPLPYVFLPLSLPSLFGFWWEVMTHWTQWPSLKITCEFTILGQDHVVRWPMRRRHLAPTKCRELDVALNDWFLCPVHLCGSIFNSAMVGHWWPWSLPYTKGVPALRWAWSTHVPTPILFFFLIKN